MDKNLRSLYDTTADNYIESNFDEDADNSFLQFSSNYDEDANVDSDEDGLFYDKDALQYDKDADSMHYEADNLFGLSRRDKRKKKERNTRATLERSRQISDLKLQREAEERNLPPEVVALNNVQQNQPLVASYVSNAGQTPQQNPAALALQATNVLQGQIAYKQSMGVPDYDTAFDAVIQDSQEDWGNEETDEFFGAILTSVFAAGKTLLEKINSNRSSKGKKPLFAGKNWQKLAQKVNDNQSVVNEALTTNERAYLALTVKENERQSAMGASMGSFADDQRNQAIRQYLPIALIVLVAVYFLGKKS